MSECRINEPYTRLIRQRGRPTINPITNVVRNFLRKKIPNPYYSRARRNHRTRLMPIRPKAITSVYAQRGKSGAVCFFTMIPPHEWIVLVSDYTLGRIYRDVISKCDLESFIWRPTDFSILFARGSLDSGPFVWHDTALCPPQKSAPLCCSHGGETPRSRWRW